MSDSASELGRTTYHKDSVGRYETRLHNTDIIKVWLIDRAAILATHQSHPISCRVVEHGRSVSDTWRELVRMQKELYTRRDTTFTQIGCKVKDTDDRLGHCPVRIPLVSRSCNGQQ